MKRYGLNEFGQLASGSQAGGDYVLFTDAEAALKELALEMLPWIGVSAVCSDEFDSMTALRIKLKSLTEGPV